MKKKNLGSLKGTWPFTCPVYVIPEGVELKHKVGDIAGVQSGRFFWMKIQIEYKHYYHDASYLYYIHHEHKHAIDRSHILRFFWGSKRLEAEAEKYGKSRASDPIPWI